MLLSEVIIRDKRRIAKRQQKITAFAWGFAIGWAAALMLMAVLW